MRKRFAANSVKYYREKEVAVRVEGRRKKKEHKKGVSSRKYDQI